MNVSGSDPRAPTGFFLWPWATTGYPNMATNTSSGGSEASRQMGPSSQPQNTQSNPLELSHVSPMSGAGMFNGTGQQDNTLESFYSRLGYSGVHGGPVPSLQQMQQHQRQQRACEEVDSEMQGTRTPIHAQQQGIMQQHHQAIGGFPDQRLMNGMTSHRQQTVNSASSSPLNSGAFHNPPISPHVQNFTNPLQRHYSSSGSLHNASATVPSSPLDGRISSSASPSVSSMPAAGPGNYSLKRHSNELNNATAMELALAVAKSDRQAQMQQEMMGTRSPSDYPLHVSTPDVFPPTGQTNYLFPPSPMKSLYGRSSEAAAMAAAMAAQAARNVSDQQDRSMAAAHQRLLGGHGGFLLGNIGGHTSPDFLSGTKLDRTGVGMRCEPSGGQQHLLQSQAISGGEGRGDSAPSDSSVDGLSGLYGHAAKGYKCKICQHVCFSRQDLATHNSKTHKQDPRPYHCDQCGRQFSTCAYLSQHRRIHSGVKPYVCRYCDRKFTQLSHVQQHERIHTGEKPYKCLTCFKSFTQMSNLQSHQRQHMKGKPHRCESCFMSYDSKEELDVHVQAKHAGNRYVKVLVCPVCSKSYNSETYLAKHMDRHKEAVSNANGVNHLDLSTPTSALGALSGFMNSSRYVGVINEQHLHEELQHHIGHPQDLHNLQRAAVAAAASFMSPMGPGGGGGNGDGNNLIQHRPSGLQGQSAAHHLVAAAQKVEQNQQQQQHAMQEAQHQHLRDDGYGSHQHQQIPSNNSYARPSFLAKDERYSKLEFQTPQPPPPLAHQQNPGSPKHQQQQQGQRFQPRQFQGPDDVVVKDNLQKRQKDWDQGSVTPNPLDVPEDRAQSVNLIDESGCLSEGSGRSVNLYSHSSAKRLKPDPDGDDDEDDEDIEDVEGRPPQQQPGERIDMEVMRHREFEQPFETEFLRRSASDACFQQPQSQQLRHTVITQDNSMEHVVDKLAKFWPLVGGAPGEKRPQSSENVKPTAPGTDLRIEALLSYATGGGFSSVTQVDDRNKENGEYQDKMRHLSQTSNNRSVVENEKNISEQGRRNYSHMRQTGFIDSDTSPRSFDQGGIPNNASTGFSHQNRGFTYRPGVGDGNVDSEQRFSGAMQQQDRTRNGHFFPRNTLFYVGVPNTSSGVAARSDIAVNQDNRAGYSRENDLKVRDLSGKNVDNESNVDAEERQKLPTF